MNKKPAKILCFDNCPEAKMALCNVRFPAVIKPYECNDPNCFYNVKDYGEAVQRLYDAFEHSQNNWVVIESY